MDDSACSVTVIDLRHRCTRDDPTFRHRGVLLFAACAHHSSSGCGVISTGLGAGAGAGSAAGGSSGSTSMGEAGSGAILRCRGMPRGRSGAMMSMGALGGSYPCAWAVVTKATSRTRRRVIPPSRSAGLPFLASVFFPNITSIADCIFDMIQLLSRENRIRWGF